MRGGRGAGAKYHFGLSIRGAAGLGAAVLELEGVTELACRPENSAAHAAD